MVARKMTSIGPTAIQMPISPTVQRGAASGHTGAMCNLLTAAILVALVALYLVLA